MTDKTPIITSTPETTSTTPAQTAQPTERQKAFVALNHPDLSDDEFILGDRKFKLVVLKYKDNLKLMSHLTPLVNVVGEFFADDVSLPDISMLSGKVNALDMVIDYCGEQLPKMVSLICNATDPEITPEWVEENAVTPFELAGIVMQYLSLGKMVQSTLDFFARILPMTMGKMKTSKSQAK